MLLLGMIAAALFYGDALITPAISVLSAVEGLEVGAPHLREYVVPLTVISCSRCSPCNRAAPRGLRRSSGR